MIWRDEADPELLCVMLRCCSGPELRILKGSAVLRSELFTTPEDVKARAASLRGQSLEALVQPA
ncbi:MAG: hypothetical protein ABL986_11575 [Vicinamibacterales bacterium]